MKANKIIIIGAGGHAKVLIDSILSADLYKIAGVLDNQLKVHQKVLGLPVLGGDEFLQQTKDCQSNFSLAIGIGAARVSDKRRIIYERYKDYGFSFPSIIHSQAYAAKGAIYREGTQILAGAFIGPDAEIGENAVIYSGGIIEHDCKIAAHCYISPGVLLGGAVEIGAGSFLGIGARILQGVKIGAQVTVGAGAVVTKDVADGKVVVGVPAKEINK